MKNRRAYEAIVLALCAVMIGLEIVERFDLALLAAMVCMVFMQRDRALAERRRRPKTLITWDSRWAERPQPPVDELERCPGRGCGLPMTGNVVTECWITTDTGSFFAANGVFHMHGLRVTDLNPASKP